MSFDPTQQQAPGQGPSQASEQEPSAPGQGPYQEPYAPGQSPYYEYNPYNSARDYSPYGADQGPYNPTQSPYDPYGALYGVPPAKPLPLGEAIRQLPGQYWKVLTKPGLRIFAQEKGKASWDIFWVQLFGYAAITGFLSIIHNRLYPIVLPVQTNTTSSGTTTVDLTNLQPFFNFIDGSGAILVTLFSFFILQGLYFGLAKAFRGQGTILKQGYAMLLFQAPLGMLNALLAFIPILGALVSLAATVYQIVLSIFAIMGVHRLSGGKATGVILIPIGVLLLLSCCIFFFVVFAAVKVTPA